MARGRGISISVISEFDPKGFERAQKEAKSMSAEFGSIAKKAAAAFAAAKVVDFGRSAVNAAVDLSESMNAVNVTFGDASESIRKLSEEAADSVGLSAAKFNSLAVSFSSFAKQVTPEGGNISETIDTMTTRVADFASVVNLDVAEAGSVFQSVLAGSSEVARQYGIDVSAAAVENYVLANGIAESKSEITEADKVLGRYALLMQGTEHMANDFANTSGSLANQQRRLAADTEDASAVLGEALIPALSGLAEVTISVVDALEQLGVLDVIAGMGDIEKKATEVGRSIRSMFDPEAARNWEVVYAVEDAEELFTQFDYTLLDGARSLSDVHDRVRELTGGIMDERTQLHLANLISIEYSKQLQERDDAYRDAQLSVSFLTEAEAKAIIATEEHRRRVEEATADFDRYETAMNDARIELQLLTGQIDDRQAWLNLQDSLDDTFEKLDGGTLSAREQEQAMIDLKLDVLAYGEQVESIPAEKLTEILTLIDEGSLAEAERQLAWLTRSREAGFEIRLPDESSWTTALELVSNSNGFGSDLSVPFGALGGVVTRPTLAVIGEAGPEAVVPLNRMPGASPLPEMGGSARYNITVNAGVGDPTSIGAAVVDAISAYERSNGKAWRAA